MLLLIVGLFGCKKLFEKQSTLKSAGQSSQANLKSYEKVAERFGLLTFGEYVSACQSQVSPDIPGVDCEAMTDIPLVSVLNDDKIPLWVNGLETDGWDALSEQKIMIKETEVKGTKSETLWIALCGKLKENPNDHESYRIAMLGYNKTTGNTCFFQSPFSMKGSKLSSPQTPEQLAQSAGAETWLSPMELAWKHKDSQACVTCHETRPIIRSKAVAFANFRKMATKMQLTLPAAFPTQEIPLLSPNYKYQVVKQDRLNDLYNGSSIWTPKIPVAPAVVNGCQKCHTAVNAPPVGAADIERLLGNFLKYTVTQSHAENETLVGSRDRPRLPSFHALHFDESWAVDPKTGNFQAKYLAQVKDVGKSCRLSDCQTEPMSSAENGSDPAKYILSKDQKILENIDTGFQLNPNLGEQDFSGYGLEFILRQTILDRSSKSLAGFGQVSIILSGYWGSPNIGRPLLNLKLEADVFQKLFHPSHSEFQLYSLQAKLNLGDSPEFLFASKKEKTGTVIIGCLPKADDCLANPTSSGRLFSLKIPANSQVLNTTAGAEALVVE